MCAFAREHSSRDCVQVNANCSSSLADTAVGAAISRAHVQRVARLSAGNASVFDPNSAIFLIVRYVASIAVVGAAARSAHQARVDELVASCGVWFLSRRKHCFRLTLSLHDFGCDSTRFASSVRRFSSCMSCVCSHTALPRPPPPPPPPPSSSPPERTMTKRLVVKRDARDDDAFDSLADLLEGLSERDLWSGRCRFGLFVVSMQKRTACCDSQVWRVDVQLGSRALSHRVAPGAGSERTLDSVVG
jgi:hypothetical protein